MYVIYYVYNTGEGEYLVRDNIKNFINNPSECIWIIPGTIDPRED